VQQHNCNAKEYTKYIGATLYVTDGDLSPPLLKVVVTVTTTFSKWNLKFFVFFLVPEAFCGLKYAQMR